MARIYLDTTLIIGYFEDQHGRKKIVESIISNHQQSRDELYTSILTYNELLTGIYAQDFQVDADEYFRRLSEFATVVTINPEIANIAARLMGLRLKTRTPETQERRHKIRWDAIHLSTADFLNVSTVYTFDEGWGKWPKEWLPNIGKIDFDPKPHPTLGI